MDPELLATALQADTEPGGPLVVASHAAATGLGVIAEAGRVWPGWALAAAVEARASARLERGERGPVVVIVAGDEPWEWPAMRPPVHVHRVAPPVRLPASVTPAGWYAAAVDLGQPHQLAERLAHLQPAEPGEPLAVLQALAAVEPGVRVFDSRHAWCREHGVAGLLIGAAACACEGLRCAVVLPLLSRLPEPVFGLLARLALGVVVVTSPGQAPLRAAACAGWWGAGWAGDLHAALALALADQDPWLLAPGDQAWPGSTTLA